ncbi:MAG: transcription antitermination factor NusB [Bacillota bacterium]
MSRRTARKNAFYLLFQMEFANSEEYTEVKEIFFEAQEIEIEAELKSFMMQLVDGVCEHKMEIDEIIDSYAKGWKVDRLSKVDLAILRLAVFELRFFPETPQGVAINEAVELAKKFSGDDAPSFVNGVLGQIIKE